MSTATSAIQYNVRIRWSAAMPVSPQPSKPESPKLPPTLSAGSEMTSSRTTSAKLNVNSDT